MVSRRGWHRGVISRIGFYYRIEMVKSSGFQEIWYKGKVNRRRKVKRSGFYERIVQKRSFYGKDGTKGWFLGEGVTK